MKTIDSMRPAGLYDRVIAARQADGCSFYERYHPEFVSVSCPVCDRQNGNAFHKFGFSHSRCTECQTLYVSPRPTDRLLGIFYTEFEAPRLWTKLLLEADRDRKKLQYQPRVEKLVTTIAPSGAKVAVDLGAGSGAFALCLKQTNAFEDVLAIDLSPDCVKACSEAGLTSKLGTISDIPDESVDLICMNDLIEHVFAPKLLLVECYRKLRPGGHISVATPNGEGFDFKILKEKTGNITPPEHLTYLNPTSISRLGELCGFDTVLTETPGILDVAILERERTAGFDLAGRNEYLDFLLSQSDEVKANFQKFLAENRLSSHLLYLGRK